jgi:catechol 2,3-dioxygenase-like lactoylglutathione lyase family enzyme
METTLNHTILPSRDYQTSSRWYEAILGFARTKESARFSCVSVNSTLTFIFEKIEGSITATLYAFKVTEPQCDEIFARIQNQKVSYTSTPESALAQVYDSQIYREHGGRGVYFIDPSGHILEILTHDK